MSEDITRKMLDTIRNIQTTNNLSYVSENKCSDDVSREMLKNIRTIINEEKDKSEKAIAITDDPRFGDRALSHQIEQFRASVDSGAQFSKPEKGNVAESPLIYIPSTANLVFSGTIPRLNNMKWQFVLKTNTGNGCFIWSDGMILSKENLQTLNKLYGFYQNWCESWMTESADLEKMVEHITD